MPRILSRFDAPPPFLAALKQLSHDGGDTERSSSASSSAVIAVIIVASAIILSSSFYLILRCVTRHCHRSLRTFSAVDEVVFHPRSNNHDSRPNCCLIDSLPLFTFGSVTGNSADCGDCAVCLSKFEANDQLRLLPLCCHAFHAQCIDTWLASNQTCPLCRSTVHPTDTDVMEKILSSEEQSNSFRIEIGSVSQRRSETDLGDGRRSYSIGSFDYIVEAGYEVSVGSTYLRESSVGKESIGITASVPASVPDENLAAEVSGRSWLRDYVDQLASISSRTLSFRSSSRTFLGSSRRSDTVVAAEDLEANHIGEDISELFRWFSGV